MAEWGRTIQDIPAFIQQSVQLGVYSSAQLMRFMTLDVRPNMTRAASRLLPASVRPVPRLHRCLLRARRLCWALSQRLHACRPAAGG